MSNDIVSAVPIEAVVNSLDETLITQALENTELDMVSSLGSSEMLWMDSFLDEISVLKTREFSDAEYKRLTDQFLLEIRKPTRTLIRLTCVFMTNMDNIFEGKKERWFPEPLPNQKTVDISDVLDECVGDYSPEDRDRATPRFKWLSKNSGSEGKVVSENEGDFYDWISENTDRSRNTLAALSLRFLQIYLLRCYVLKYDYSNGDLYKKWAKLFKVDCPPAALPVSETRIDDIRDQMKLNFEDVRRVVAMCIRRLHISTPFDSAPQLQTPFDYFFTEPICLGLRLKVVYDAVIRKKGWSPSTLKSKLKSEAAKAQLKNYLRKMRYIVWGLSGNAKLTSGEPFTTRFYWYSRGLDERFFDSLDLDRNIVLLYELSILHGE